MNEQPNPAYNYYPQPELIDYNMFNQPSFAVPTVTYRIENATCNEGLQNKLISINKTYLESTLCLIRVLLIISLIATVIASALVRNTDWAVRAESSYNVSVWLSVLVFSCVELALSLLIFLFFAFNFVNLPGLNPKTCFLIVSFCMRLNFYFNFTY